MQSLLLAVDNGDEIDNKTDIATLELDTLNDGDRHARLQALLIRTPPSAQATKTTLRTLVQNNNNKSLPLAIFEASLKSQNRTASSAAKKARTHLNAKPPPTAASIATAQRAAEEARQGNKKQSKPASAPARPTTPAAAANNGNKSGNVDVGCKY